MHFNTLKTTVTKHLNNPVLCLMQCICALDLHYNKRNSKNIRQFLMAVHLIKLLALKMSGFIYTGQWEVVAGWR